MRPRQRRAVATGVLLTAALVALCACGTDADGRQATRGAVPSATSAGPDDGAGQHGQHSPAGSASAVPKLPDARLTPATGSFTKKEKKYLSGRVPAGTDPSAVLQLGQEACQRVARTARHDRNAAVAAVIAGDIPGAQDAITQLCPDQRPVLRAAEAGFPDGTKDKPAAGTYRTLTATSSCAWRAVGAAGKVLASGSAAGPGGSGSGKEITAKIPAGTRQFVSSDCYAWVPD